MLTGVIRGIKELVKPVKMPALPVAREPYGAGEHKDGESGDDEEGEADDPRIAAAVPERPWDPDEWWDEYVNEKEWALAAHGIDPQARYIAGLQVADAVDYGPGQPGGQRLPYLEGWSYHTGVADPFTLSGPSSAAWHFRLATTFFGGLEAANSISLMDFHLAWGAITMELDLAYARNAIVFGNSIFNLADYGLGVDAATRYSYETRFQCTIARGVGGIHHLSSGSIPATARCYMRRRMQPFGEVDTEVFPIATTTRFPLCVMIDVCGPRQLVTAEAKDVGVSVAHLRGTGDIVKVVGQLCLRRDSVSRCLAMSLSLGPLAVVSVGYAGLPLCSPDVTFALLPNWFGIAGGGYMCVLNHYFTSGEQNLRGFLRYRGCGEFQVATLVDIATADDVWEAFDP